MSISFTYTSLRAALIAWMEDDFEDFTDQLDNIIKLAESRCEGDLNLDLFDQVDASSVLTTAGEPTFTLADIGEDAYLLRHLWVNGVLLEPKHESYVYYYNDLSAAGQPLYWAQTTASLIRVAPTPDAEYSTRQIFRRLPPSLVAATSSTFLSRYAGDLLFAACKAHAESFDKAPEDQAAAWAEYERILPTAQNRLKMLGPKHYADMAR